MKEDIEEIINQELDKINPSAEDTVDHLCGGIEIQVEEQNKKVARGVVEITENEFKEVTKEGKVLVDCYANWCGPCKMLSPIIDKIANENDTYSFYKLDIDQAEDIAREYEIMSIPTLLIFEDGKLKETSVGLKSKSEIENMLK